MSITVFLPGLKLLSGSIKERIKKECEISDTSCIEVRDDPEANAKNTTNAENAAHATNAQSAADDATVASGTVWKAITERASQVLLGSEFHFALVIEAHCDFQVMTAFVNTLCLLDFPSNVKGSFIFTSNHFDSMTPELDDATADALPLVSNLRYSQFYLRMFESYGWSNFTRDNRLHSLLRRMESMNDEYLRLTRASHLGWKGDFDRIKKAIDERLNLGVWANTPQPNKLVNGWEGSKELSKRFFHGLSENLLEAMALTHQFGRLNSLDAERKISQSGIRWLRKNARRKSHVPGFSPPHLRNLLQESTIASRDLYETVKGTTGQGRIDLDRELVRKAGIRNEIRANLFVFDLLRDCSQMLSKGTAIWAVESADGENENNTKPIKILAIKDRIRGEKEQKLTEELFRSAFTAAFRPGTLQLHCIDYQGTGENQAWDKHEWWLERIDGREQVRVREDSGSGALLETSLLNYDILLIEAEYSNRFVGPSIIQWLDHMFDEAETSASFKRPQVFILSRDENAGHSFMCLWLGAQAFASKSRIFGIPALLTVSNIRGFANNPDKKRLRPNFYALEGLLPHQRNRLQSLKRRDVVHGDDWDRLWIKKLPKADLHYHIGTSISLDAIKALAANTVGHMIEYVSEDLLDAEKSAVLCIDNVLGKDGEDKIAKEVILNACKVALLYATERAESDTARNVDPYKHLWGAARFILLPVDRNGRVVPKDAPEFNALDVVVQWFVRNDRPVRSHEACAILVTAITVLECMRNGLQAAEEEFARKVYANWMGLESAAKWLKGGDSDSLVGYLGTNLFYLLERVAVNWKDNYTGSSVRKVLDNAGSVGGRGSAPDFVSGLAEASMRRAVKVFAVFKRAFEELTCGKMWNWLFLAEESFNKHGAEPMFSHIGDLVEKSIKDREKLFALKRLGCHISLEELVSLPTGIQYRSAGGSLKRYLVGCDLLGAEHLQYPENILLAACDVTRQNAEDNVVYSELRCATTGYSRGGMNVIDATDLLCKGFDLGAVLFGSRDPGERIKVYGTVRVLRLRGKAIVKVAYEWAKVSWDVAPRRWIRSNVLLGAKRHKAGDVENVVPLVVHYLERGPEVWRRRIGGLPPGHMEPGNWWKPCCVAGFDLSGNEAAAMSNLEQSIRPLFAACSPITIHAGEAMSAKSIWEAVYKLSAQRIGHGLRLRDDSRLLEHCVRNGICMELCPVSNAFTNSFKPVARPEFNSGKEQDPSHKRDEYPMLDFLSAGLEVCLNTDNRSIHPARSTLTDEYLTAAQMCGGMTKWEILRVAKAGFKNAFLAKDDVASLLRHVEYEVYKLVCEHSGENKFPQVERFMSAIANR